MGWEFEHWDNGKVYLHNDNWLNFKDRLEKYGSYPHNWDHNRVFFQLHSPRDLITDVPAPGDNELKYKIEDVDNSYSTIYETYPAFVRTGSDPEGWLSSWHVFAEDKHSSPLGEPISILKTSDIFNHENSIYISFRTTINTFAFFRGQFWRLEDFQSYGVGPNPPPPPQIKRKRAKHARNINEPFEQSW